MSEPIVIDTDAGYDPDDALAVTIAALHLPDLALVTTCDEHEKQRARLVRTILDYCGRPDVPVVAGAELPGAHARFVATHLVSDRYGQIDGDLPAAVAAIAEARPGPIRWIGLGPMSNLSSLTQTYPELVGHLQVWQMGGAIAYRDPDRAEHNIRLDVEAARRVLRTFPNLHLVTSEVTFTPELEVTLQSPIYRSWCRPGAPRWAQLLRAHIDLWVKTTGHKGSMAHDPLTLGVALGEPLAKFDRDFISLDEIGRMAQDARGSEIYYTHSADYAAAREWLFAQLNPWPSNH